MSGTYLGFAKRKVNIPAFPDPVEAVGVGTNDWCIYLRRSGHGMESKALWPCGDDAEILTLHLNPDHLISQVQNNVIMNVCRQPHVGFSTQMNYQKAENAQMVLTY